MAPSSPDGHTTFGVLRTDGRATADRLVRTWTEEVRAHLRRAPGFLAAHLHLADDGTTLVDQGEWASEADYRKSFRDNPDCARLRGIGDWPGVEVGTAFAGRAAPGIEGPAAGADPAVVVVAIRHLTEGAADRVLDLLRESAGWKRSFPGFISATPFVNRDGTLFVNHPKWDNETAYAAWVRDPRITEGQGAIAHWETAPPEYLRCTVVSGITAEPTG